MMRASLLVCLGLALHGVRSLSEDMVTKPEATRDILSAAEEIDAHVRRDDAADRAETDVVVGLEVGVLISLEKERKAFQAECKATEEDANALEGRIRGSGAMLDARGKQLQVAQDLLGSYGYDCERDQEPARSVQAISARLSTVVDLNEEIRKEVFSPLEEDPCTLASSGDQTKDACNDVSMCEDALCSVRRSKCVFDPKRKRCFSAVAAEGTTALKNTDIEKAMAMLKDTTAFLDGELTKAKTAAMAPVEACAQEQEQRIKVSMIESSISEVKREVQEWKDAADYKRRQLKAAVPILEDHDAKVGQARARVERLANEYQTRRNVRVGRLLCDTTALRMAFASEGEDVGTALLPGPAQYPGATVEATDSAHCEQRMADMSDTQVVVSGGRPPIIYRGGPGFGDNWATRAAPPHIEPVRTVDVDL